MPKPTLFFKVTSDGWNKPTYIAACSEEDAKLVAHTLPSNQAVHTVMTAEVVLAEDIPVGSFVNTDILGYQESKAVATCLNAMAGQSIADRRKQHGFDINRPE